jgi:hypothetical protein
LNDPQRTIRCDSYKLKASKEYTYGDMAVLVDLRYSDGMTHQGVGFLEAEKRDPGKIGFSAFKRSQISRIFDNAALSFVLLYDFQDARTSWSDLDLSYRSRTGCQSDSWSTRAVVIPMGIVADKAKLDTSIYKFALPLSYQLVFRYFRGLDLHYAKATLEDVLEYVQNRRTQYLLTARVAEGEVPDLGPFPVGKEYIPLEAVAHEHEVN